MLKRIPILVVDDDLANRKLAHEWLRHEGFEAIEAEDGPRAAGALRFLPSLRLVITDFQLKVGSATSLHREVREIIAERRGLFCVLTAAEMEDERYIDPRNKPHVDYLRQHGVPIFRKPSSWGEIIIPYLQTWLATP